MQLGVAFPAIEERVLCNSLVAQRLCFALFAAASMFLLNACAGPAVGDADLDTYFQQDPRVARLIKAAIRTDLAGMERAVRDGADPNFVGGRNLWPLYIVLDKPYRNKVSAKKLLDLGANINFSDGFRCSVPFAAGVGDSPDILEFALQNGGDANAECGPGGGFSVERASDLGYLENVKLLVRYGHDVNRLNKGGHVSAISSALSGQYEILCFLLDSGLHTQINKIADLVFLSGEQKNTEDEKWRQLVIQKLIAKGAVWPPVFPKKAHS